MNYSKFRLCVCTHVGTASTWLTVGHMGNGEFLKNFTQVSQLGTILEFNSNAVGICKNTQGLLLLQ